jgi:hypothetical protein
LRFGSESKIHWQFAARFNAWGPEDDADICQAPLVSKAILTAETPNDILPICVLNGKTDHKQCSEPRTSRDVNIGNNSLKKCTADPPNDFYTNVKGVGAI